MYEWNWQTIAEYLPFVARGIPMTLLVSFGAIAIGVILGVVIGLLRTMAWPAVQRALLWFVELFRNTPVLVQIVYFYYAVPLLLQTKIGPLQAGIVAIGLNTAAYISEIVRGGIVGVGRSQVDAARSLGLSKLDTMRKVILPQAARRMVAPTANMFVVVMKESALVSYIGVAEILHRGDVVQVQTFRPLEVYTMVAVLFLLLITGMTRLMAMVERRWTPVAE